MSRVVRWTLSSAGSGRPVKLITVSRKVQNVFMVFFGQFESFAVLVDIAALCSSY